MPVARAGKFSQIKNNEGFTLIELSIVLIITGVLIITLFGLYAAFTKGARVEKEKRIIEIASKTLDNYLSEYDRLPCPADPTLPRTHANYGREVRAAGGTTCEFAAAGAVQRPVGARNVGQPPVPVRVAVGMMPLYTFEMIRDPVTGVTRATRINMSDSNLMPTEEVFQTDFQNAWGHSLTYAVTEGLVNESNMSVEIGAIRIVDDIPPYNDTAGTNSNALYAVVSHGANDCRDDHRLEEENCDNDATFRLAFTNHNTANNFNDYFDDKLAFFAPVFSGRWAPIAVGATVTDHTTKLLTGRVGIGKTNPTEMLDVNGDMLATSYVRAGAICDPNIPAAQRPQNCFSPETLTLGNISCPNTGEYIKQIFISGYNLRVVCQPISFPGTGAVCPNGTFLQGIYSDGTLECN